MSVTFGNNLPFRLIAGPCQMESRQHGLECALAIAEIARALGLAWVYKASFDKANRTSGKSARGVGMDIAAEVFTELRSAHGIVSTTDVHEPYQCALIAPALAIVQIPALLCRQTDLLAAAAATGKPVNVKKGQFMDPAAMRHAVAKAGERALVTERGTTFGYGDLVVDMRGLVTMREFAPVIFDASHSVQRPAAGGASSSGGVRAHIAPLARAAVAVGVAGLFVETHADPDRAPSDGASMLPLAGLRGFLAPLIALDAVTKGAAPAA